MDADVAKAAQALDQASDVERKDEEDSRKAARYPEDAVLIARGKHATLSRERRAQIERVQAIVTTIISEAHGVMRDCQRERKAPPQEPQRMERLGTCLANLGDARSRLVDLCKYLQELNAEAWQ